MHVETLSLSETKRPMASGLEARQNVFAGVRQQYAEKDGGRIDDEILESGVPGRQRDLNAFEHQGEGGRTKQQIGRLEVESKGEQKTRQEKRAEMLEVVLN